MDVRVRTAEAQAQVDKYGRLVDAAYDEKLEGRITDDFREERTASSSMCSSRVRSGRVPTSNSSGEHPSTSWHLGGRDPQRRSLPPNPRGLVLTGRAEWMIVAPSGWASS